MLVRPDENQLRAIACPQACIVGRDDRQRKVARPGNGGSGFAIGCQAWTFNHFTVTEAIDKTAAVGGKVGHRYHDQVDRAALRG